MDIWSFQYMGYVLLSKRFIIIVITINTIAMQKAQAHYKG